MEGKGLLEGDHSIGTNLKDNISAHKMKHYRVKPSARLQSSSVRVAINLCNSKPCTSTKLGE